VEEGFFVVPLQFLSFGLLFFATLLSCLVELVFVKLSHIVALIAVDPSTAEEARSFALKLTDDLATAHAVVDQGMLGALAVAQLPSFRHLAEVPDRHFLHGLVFGDGLSLDHFDLFFVITLSLNLQDELFGELNDFLEGEVKGELLVNQGQVRAVDRILSDSLDEVLLAVSVEVKTLQLPHL